MKKILTKYRWVIGIVLVNLLLFIWWPEKGVKSLQITQSNLLQMLSIIPPVFILLGLLDVWVDKQTMIKYTGSGSGLWGSLIAFLLGSAAAGPLYVGFPIAAIMLKKGSSLFNVFLFVGAWSTTKIPMMLFEISNMGYKFGLLRLAINILGISIISFILDKTTTIEEDKTLRKKASQLME